MRHCKLFTKCRYVCFQHIMLFCLLLLPVITSCHHAPIDLTDESIPAHTRDSLTYLYERNYTWGQNLTVCTDSVTLVRLPLKKSFSTLRRNDRVVVAEFAIHPQDSIDSVWVKLAHSQEEQGWIRECEMKRTFIPADSVSQAIYLFSETHVSYFMIVFATFAIVWLLRAFRRKKLQLVYFNDIDSLYPLLLCLLTASAATIYESMQVFTPDLWERFYYNPTLSPLHVPLPLSLFLGCFWGFIIVLLATLDESFRLLSPMAAFSYLLGLAAACIFCYFFSILTTHIYIGYVFLIGFFYVFIRRVRIGLHNSHYRCGHCGRKLAQKGMCPYCKTINE